MINLDLSFYDGDDRYSDGDIEDKIIEYIKENETEDYNHIFDTDHQFEVFYHLSDIRRNLMSWYDFKPEAELLEIGGGMGAFTNLFCDKCRQVTSVELSKRRASAIKERCRDKDNLDIIVGDLSKIEFSRKYDYITVLGVLEYQSIYGNSLTPQADFLKKLHSLLKPDGKLFIAIENKLGLKYWCGEVDDHSGIPFGTINDFEYGGDARTFDKNELEQMLSDAGFVQQKFYYPLPDYKFPRVIYTDKFIPKQNIHSSVLPIYYSHYFYRDLPIIAHEQSLYEAIMRNDTFPFFANSFLVECAMEDIPFDKTDFISITSERNDAYKVGVSIKDERVCKYPINMNAQRHIRQSYENIMALKRSGISVVEHQFENGVLSTPFMPYPTLEDKVIQEIKKRNKVNVCNLLDEFLSLINRSSEKVDPKKNALYEMGLAKEDDNHVFGDILQTAYYDLILSNCFCIDDDFFIYDQEWKTENMPAGFMMFRALKVIYEAYDWLENYITLDYLKTRYNLVEVWDLFVEAENFLFAGIQNRGTCSMIGAMREIPENTISDNIELLKTGKIRIENLHRDLAATQNALEDRTTETKKLYDALEERAIIEKKLYSALEERGETEKILYAALEERGETEKILYAALEERGETEKILYAALEERAETEKTLQAALNECDTRMKSLTEELNETNNLFADVSEKYQLILNSRSYSLILKSKNIARKIGLIK